MSYHKFVQIALVVLLSTPATYAITPPSNTWVRQFGNPGADSGNAAIADGVGGVYIGGTLSHPNGTGINGFIYHFDASGTNTLSTVINSGQDDDVRSIAVDKSSGSIFATGVTTGNLGAPFAGALDIYVGRFTTNGSNVWIRQFGTSDYDVPYAMSIDPLGSIYVVGDTAGALNTPDLLGYDAFAMKLDYDGNTIWLKQFGSNSNDTAADVWADANGNAYMAGRSADNAFIWKFDTLGNLVWTRTLSTTAFDSAAAIQGDGAGYLYVGGVTDGGLMGGNLGDRDAFIAKYTTSGDLEWITQIGTNKSDGIIDLSVDKMGNPYIAGWTGGSIGSANKGGYDAYVSKLDRNSGSVLFTAQIGTSGEDSAYGVTTDTFGNFFATGYVRGNLAGTLSGTDDAWVGKFNVPEPSGIHMAIVAGLFWMAACKNSSRKRVKLGLN